MPELTSVIVTVLLIRPATVAEAVAAAEPNTDTAVVNALPRTLTAAAVVVVLTAFA